MKISEAFKYLKNRITTAAFGNTRLRFKGLSLPLRSTLALQKTAAEIGVKNCPYTGELELSSGQIQEARRHIGLAEPVEIVYYPCSALDLVHPVVLVDARKYILADMFHFEAGRIEQGKPPVNIYPKNFAIKAINDQLSEIGATNIRISSSFDTMLVSFHLFWRREITLHSDFDVFMGAPQELRNGFDVLFG